MTEMPIIDRNCRPKTQGQSGRGEDSRKMRGDEGGDGRGRGSSLCLVVMEGFWGFVWSETKRHTVDPRRQELRVARAPVLPHPRRLPVGNSLSSSGVET